MGDLSEPFEITAVNIEDKVREFVLMTPEEREVHALPENVKRFMAVAVLRGFKFERKADMDWRGWDPQGNPVTQHVYEGVPTPPAERPEFTALMFVLDRIGFNEWLEAATKRSLWEQGYKVDYNNI